jgi:hypothetical protein
MTKHFILTSEKRRRKNSKLMACSGNVDWKSIADKIYKELFFEFFSWRNNTFKSTRLSDQIQIRINIIGDTFEADDSEKHRQNNFYVFLHMALENLD